MAAAAFDSLAILTSTGPLATKRIIANPAGGPPKIENYGKGRHFRIDEISVSSFDEMAAVLASIEHQPRAFLVRGKPIDGINRLHALRRSRARPDKNEPATLEAAARRWVALDLDAVPCPSGVDPLFEPDRVVEHVVELLPEEFHGATCWWMFSSGHGIKPGIRIRLFFWLTQPLEDWQLKTWLRASKVVDLSLFAPAQATYVAKPIFVGMPDPVPFRSGIWRGHGDVNPPTIEKPQAREREAGGGSEAGGSYADQRARIGDHRFGGGFYGPIRAALGMFFRDNGADADRAWVRIDLEDAIRSAHRDPHLHDDAYVEHRVADLDPWIEWVAEREAEKKAEAEPPIEPTYAKPLGSVEDARAVLRATMQSIVRQVHEYRAAAAVPDPYLGAPEPPAWGVSVDVALGKTRAFREVVAAELVGDGLSVVLAVPEHKLGDEIVRDFAKAGITAQAYRGRDRDDPDALGEKMCREHERAAEIFHAMGDVEKHACGKPDSEHVCEFYSVCGYRRQRKATPQVWLIPSVLLFQPKPNFIPAPDLLGIDERFHDYGLEGTDAPRYLALAALTGDRTIEKADQLGRKIVDSFATADLTEISRRAHGVLTAHRDGAVLRKALIQGGLIVDDLRNAQKLEWRRKLDLEIYPGMPRRAAIAACKKIATHNGFVRKLARLWHLIASQVEGGQERSPWLSVDSIEDEVRMAWRKDIHETWRVPTIVMDATLQPEIARQFFPNMTGPVRIAAPMPNTYVRQITNRPMSKATLIATEGAAEHRNQSRENNIERLRRLIEVPADDIAPGTGVVICQEAVELALKDGPLPGNIEVVHFNAIRGLNRWSDVALLMVVGRTLPSPRDAERIAGVLFGEEVEPIPIKGNV
jgi:hypothetical protein